MKCVIELIFITILFVSCQKSEEDKLYGRWQFRDCEYPTGETFTNDSIYQRRQRQQPAVRAIHRCGRFPVDNLPLGQPVQPQRGSLSLRREKRKAIPHRRGLTPQSHLVVP